jgi:hypothetical protein
MSSGRRAEREVAQVLKDNDAAMARKTTQAP